MPTAKEEVRKILDRLPDDASLEDIQYHIYVVQKVERGLAEADTGRTLSHDEVKRRMDGAMNNKRTSIKVGDVVRFELVNRLEQGIVVEDRGNIGKDGRQLLRVRVDFGEGGAIDFELPADEIELVPVGSES